MPAGGRNGAGGGRRAVRAGLEAGGAARRCEGVIEAWDYAPLAEADRVAAEIDARLLAGMDSATPLG